MPQAAVRLPELAVVQAAKVTSVQAHKLETAVRAVQEEEARAQVLEQAAV